MDVIKQPLNVARATINNGFNGKEPWQIVSVTASSVLLSVWLYNFIFDEESLLERGKKFIFKLAKCVPSIKSKIDSELQAINDGFMEDVQKRTGHLNYIVELPKTGLSGENVLKLVDENLNIGDFNWKDGKVSGSVYVNNANLISLVTEVYSKTSYTNPLHADLFPGLCKMEAEVVRIAANLFHGDENSCGTMTSGGTESIMMACKALRDYGRQVKGIKKPEIVVPVTAHSAFDKAAQYLKLRVRSVPVDPITTQVDVKAMKRAINCNTVMLVGSLPNYPYGTMDDIQAISQLGVKYNVPVHVDSCLGGFLTVFMEDAGYPIPISDFRLPGVVSISADTHKYGFTPKGSSIVLYRDKKYRHHQYTVTTDWPGGVYGSPTVSGSRAGGNIAVCWATLLTFGKEGYVKATRDIVHTAKYIEKGLKRIKGIFIFGQPITSVIALGSNDFDIYRLSDLLQKSGWNLNALQFPSGIHICITQLHLQAGVADQFINDVRVCVSEIMKDPSGPVKGKLALYGVAQKLPDRSIVTDFARLFIDSMYYTPKILNK